MLRSWFCNLIKNIIFLGQIERMFEHWFERKRAGNESTKMRTGGDAMSEKDNSSEKKPKDSTNLTSGKKKLFTSIIGVIIVLLSLIFGKELPEGLTDLFSGLSDSQEEFLDTGGEKLVVTYLDVGQADCTILQCGESSMMIDGGGRGTAKEVIEAAEDLVFREEDKDTKIYEDFKSAVKESGATVIVPKPGVSFEFGNALVEIFAPRETEYDNTNNYSSALVVTFGKEKFLFTGDAEEESEAQMLELGTLPDVDVFQAGHHGSETSNSEAFLKVVIPAYAIISCGVDNKYGHPHAEVIARFEDMDMQIYRTDVMGTITIKTDGKTLDFSTQRFYNQLL